MFFMEKRIFIKYKMIQRIVKRIVKYNNSPDHSYWAIFCGFDNKLPTVYIKLSAFLTHLKE